MSREEELNELQQRIEKNKANAELLRKREENIEEEKLIYRKNTEKFLDTGTFGSDVGIAAVTELATSAAGRFIPGIGFATVVLEASIEDEERQKNIAAANEGLKYTAYQGVAADVGLSYLPVFQAMVP